MSGGEDGAQGTLMGGKRRPWDFPDDTIQQREENQLLCNWLEVGGARDLREKLVDAHLAPRNRSTTGNRASKLVQRATSMGQTPGVAFDSVNYQYLVKYYPPEEPNELTIRRFPLRRWGFSKAYRQARDLALENRVGTWRDDELKQMENPSIAKEEAKPEEPEGNGVTMTEYYMLPDHPEILLPVVKGISRDKKSKRWAVNFKRNRQYFYDKHEGGIRAAYMDAVNTRRQQVQDLELCHLSSRDDLVNAGGDPSPELTECKRKLFHVLRDITDWAIRDLTARHEIATARENDDSEKIKQVLPENIKTSTIENNNESNGDNATCGIESLNGENNNDHNVYNNDGVKNYQDTIKDEQTLPNSVTIRKLMLEIYDAMLCHKLCVQKATHLPQLSKYVALLLGTENTGQEASVTENGDTDHDKGDITQKNTSDQNKTQPPFVSDEMKPRLIFYLLGYHIVTTFELIMETGLKQAIIKGAMPEP